MIDIKSILSGLAQGVLKPVKDLISEIVVDKDKRNDIIQAMDLAEKNFQTKIAELDEADRASARSREVELAKTGRSDWFKNFVGIIIMSAFLFMLYVVVYVDIPEKNVRLFDTIFGLVIGAAIGNMVNYYWGTSKGSTDKSDAIYTIMSKQQIGQLDKKEKDK